MDTTINLKEFAETAKKCIDCCEPYKTEAEEKLDELKKILPSGSGLDAGVQFNYQDPQNKQPETKLVFTTSFHHMDEDGFYDGWTDHKVVITPNLIYGFDIRITGQNRRDIKSYLHDLFHNVFYMPKN